MITIEPTEFKHVRSGEITFGFRMYDEYAHSYDNNWDDIPADDLEILRRVLTVEDEGVQGMLTFCRMNTTGLNIGGNWYDYEDIQHMLNSRSE